MRRVCWALYCAAAATTVAGSRVQLRSDPLPTYAYETWRDPVVSGNCSDSASPQTIPIPRKGGGPDGQLSCATENGVKVYRFPAGVFEIDEQLLVPERTTIEGAANPNPDILADPTRSPDWSQQTLFLATRGATDWLMSYCSATDMVRTRVGFVLSSFVTIRRVAYQGVDTIRPKDNGSLCGGGAFETKGCAANDCSASPVNNGGSDGVGPTNVTIEDVRVNDFFHRADHAKIGVDIPGNNNCINWSPDVCCFCQPNGVRASQVAVWVPSTRNEEGTRHLRVTNVVSMATQADGINLHGAMYDMVVRNAYMANTGDDSFALWGAARNPYDVTFDTCTAYQPGVLRPKWYGNCVATYGVQNVTFRNITCRAPTLTDALPEPGDNQTHIDTSMFTFYFSFGASYPPGHRIDVDGYTFTDLSGQTAYAAAEGSLGRYEPGKMVWTQSTNNVTAPFFLPNGGNITVIVGAMEE